MELSNGGGPTRPLTGLSMAAAAMTPARHAAGAGGGRAPRHRERNKGGFQATTPAVGGAGCRGPGPPSRAARGASEQGGAEGARSGRGAPGGGGGGRSRSRNVAAARWRTAPGAGWQQAHWYRQLWEQDPLFSTNFTLAAGQARFHTNQTKWRKTAKVFQQDKLIERWDNAWSCSCRPATAIKLLVAILQMCIHICGHIYMCHYHCVFKPEHLVSFMTRWRSIPRTRQHLNKMTGRPQLECQTVENKQNTSRCRTYVTGAAPKPEAGQQPPLYKCMRRGVTDLALVKRHWVRCPPNWPWNSWLRKSFTSRQR